MNLEALRKLRNDFTYYAPRMLKIVDKSGSIIPLNLNRAQLYAHEMMESQLSRTGKVRAIILKGRQQGLSTYVEARNFHKTSMNKGQSAYILTHQDKSTTAIFDMVKNYYDLTPESMRPVTGKANSNELLFNLLKSKYTVGTAGSKAIGRGLTAQLFHGSEVAFWDNSDAHLAGIGQAIGDIDGTEIVLESTANGLNKFHQMCQDALRGIGDYQLIFVPWFWEPAYRRKPTDDFVLDGDEAAYADRYDVDIEQMAWRKNKTQTDFGGDYAWFDQEYPASVALAFRKSASNSFISLELVEDAMTAQISDDQSAAPKIMGVDPAEYGDDGTAIAKRQGRIIEPIQRYYKKGTMEVAGLVAIEADQYKPDAINVDCTGIGSGVADRLLEMGYPVNRVHFGSKAMDDKLYARRKDEMYGEFKKWLEDSPAQLPNDEILKSDCVVAGYSYDSSRRLILESKEKIKARGLPSPDSSDAVALTFAVRIYPKLTKQKPRSTYNWKAG